MSGKVAAQGDVGAGVDAGGMGTGGTHATTSSHEGKPTAPLRWAMLVLGVMIIVGPYYSFDNPAGTQTALRGYFGVPVVVTANSSASDEAAYTMFNTQYQLLYSLYSLPNTVLPLFGGYLVDLLGVRSMTLACSGLALVGQVLVIVGLNASSWPIMWAGRAVFGAGLESLCVAQRILVAQWFIGKELALAMGSILALGRFGSVINFNVSALYTSQHVLGAYCVGASLCVASCIAAVFAVWLDASYDAAHGGGQAVRGGKPPHATGGTVHDVGGEDHAVAAVRGEWEDGFVVGWREDENDDWGEEVGEAEAGHRPVVNGIGEQVEPLLLESDGVEMHVRRKIRSGRLSRTSSTLSSLLNRTPITGRIGKGPIAPVVAKLPPPPRCQAVTRSMHSIASFDAGYWFLLVVVITGFAPITTFNGVGAALLTARFMHSGQDSDQQTVNAQLGIVYTVAAVAAPFAGAVVDRAKRRGFAMSLAQGAICACHLLFALSTAHAAGMLAVMGLGFAIFASSFWTAIAYVVPSHATGLAYGLMGALQNTGLAIAPLVVAKLQPPACGSSFQCVSLFLAGMAAVACMASAVEQVVEGRTLAARGHPLPMWKEVASSIIMDVHGTGAWLTGQCGKCMGGAQPSPHGMHEPLLLDDGFDEAKPCAALVDAPACACAQHSLNGDATVGGAACHATGAVITTVAVPTHGAYLVDA